MNIYSYLLNVALFATLLIFIYIEIRNYYIIIQVSDVLIFIVFFLGVVLCFSFSCLFHILSNYSKEVIAFWNRLNYLGIVILIQGSIIPSIYYGFYYNLNLQRLYQAIVSILAIAYAIVILALRFQYLTFRLYRTSIYVLLSLLAIVFIIYKLIIYS